MFRLRDFRRDANLTQKDVAELFECAQSNIAAIEKEGKDLMAAQLDVLIENYGKELVVSYMSPGEPKESEYSTVPLLPISAQGGSLNDFVVSLNGNGYEKIISPIKGADFAITVSGESMAPEYSSGSKILIKKINEKSFIEWGRCYVLDTCNGTVIKKLAPPEEEDPDFGLNYVTCISVNQNPIYKPFRVSTKDIYGIYRVLMLLTEK